MNGHDYDRIAATGQREMADDGDVWQMVDIECPFCGYDIARGAGKYFCGNCEVSWPSTAAVDADRGEPPQ